MNASGAHAHPKSPTSPLASPRPRLLSCDVPSHECTVAFGRLKRETEATLKRMQTDIDNLRWSSRN